MKQIAEQILSNLPTILLIWTAITLCWGLYIKQAMAKMAKVSEIAGSITPSSYQTNLTCLMLINACLILILVLSPWLGRLGDAVIVINIFYNIYLTTLTAVVLKWWHRISNS